MSPIFLDATVMRCHISWASYEVIVAMLRNYFVPLKNGCYILHENYAKDSGLDQNEI